MIQVSQLKVYATLFLVGMALSIAQFIMIRDFTSVLYGEELIIVFVTVAFFVGLSVGYYISRKISQKIFFLLCVLALFLQLTFPFSFRYAAIFLSQWENNLFWAHDAYLALLTVNTIGMELFSPVDADLVLKAIKAQTAYKFQRTLLGCLYVFLPFAYSVLFSSLFAVFLPRLVHVSAAGGDENTRLKLYYTLELAGFICGIILITFAWNNPISAVLVPYWVILFCILLTITHKPLVISVYATVVTFAIIYVNYVDIKTTELIYAYKHHLKNPKLIFTSNSPYQKVEVVDADGSRNLYLDGLKNLDRYDLADLNYYIAEVPAKLLCPKHTLIVGNGTLSSVPKLHPLSATLESVELDPSVLQIARYFVDTRYLKTLRNWRLEIADGKAHIRNSKKIYDLIILDVPSPLTIQTGVLHTVEMFQAINKRLSSRGVFAVQLSGRFDNANDVPGQITSALRKVFPHVVVIYSYKADRGFAYASRSVELTPKRLQIEAAAYEKKSLEVFTTSQIDAMILNTPPMSLDNMSMVLQRGIERFRERYFE